MYQLLKLQTTFCTHNETATVHQWLRPKPACFGVEGSQMHNGGAEQGSHVHQLLQLHRAFCRHSELLDLSVAKIRTCLLHRCPRARNPQWWCRPKLRCASAAEAVQGGARAAEQGCAVLQAELQRSQAPPQVRGDARCICAWNLK